MQGCLQNIDTQNIDRFTKHRQIYKTSTDLQNIDSYSDSLKSHRFALYYWHFDVQYNDGNIGDVSGR